jgi:hypothetical protein
LSSPGFKEFLPFGLQIVSNTVYSRMVKLWSPPAHWSKKRRDAHDRSIQFIREIASQSPQIHIDYPKAIVPGLFIRGASGRWYKIDVSINSRQEWLPEFGFVEETVFSLHVSGAVYKSDLVEENVYETSLCIHPDEKGRALPVGDQLAALALALCNDRVTSLRIPLLAQFIVTERRMLKDIYQFAEEGVMTIDDLDTDFIRNAVNAQDPFEEVYGVECDEPTPSLFEIHAEWRREAELREEMALDDWFKENDRRFAIKENEVPWHHDEDKIWAMEDKLRKGHT